MAGRTANVPAGCHAQAARAQQPIAQVVQAAIRHAHQALALTSPPPWLKLPCSAETIDSYDISILNGTNVAVEMTPTSTLPFNPSGQSPSEYNCTSPGKPTQTNGLGNCTWSFTPPSTFPVAGSSYKYRTSPQHLMKGAPMQTSCLVAQFAASILIAMAAQSH